MRDIFYIDRLTKKTEKERVYGAFFLNLLYGEGVLVRWMSPLLRILIAKVGKISSFYGHIQKMGWSRYKIMPFIKKFHVDETEFLEPVESFHSFNDFFIRRLQPSARPLAPGNDIAILPADGRYLVFQNLARCEGFFVKGVCFSLEQFLLERPLSETYRQGSMAIARLCPSDYHRFHFPCNCLPQKVKEIPGDLYSVNPNALRKDGDILTKNKRACTTLLSKPFGQIAYIEVGATYVGTIHQTFIPGELYAKGDEKGYFSFGGSCIVLLFEPGRIQFDQDLIEASQKGIEVRGLLGQTLGRSLVPY